jgi:hypothetical protein
MPKYYSLGGSPLIHISALITSTGGQVGGGRHNGLDNGCMSFIVDDRGTKNENNILHSTS